MLRSPNVEYRHAVAVMTTSTKNEADDVAVVKRTCSTLVTEYDDGPTDDDDVPVGKMHAVN